MSLQLAPPPLEAMTPGLPLDEIKHHAVKRSDPTETLGNIVRLIQNHFRCDVCSVYLIQPDRANLVLAATIGLRPESVGRVRMRLDEGLTGLVAEELRPIVVEDVRKHGRFKYFPEAGEDAYQSFVGVPLVEHSIIQGVLVIQTLGARVFSRDEIGQLTAAAGASGPSSAKPAP